ncbi:putative DNA-directed RNA polymerase I subunit RPA43 [Monocercomonoides exilis]|uniref:putative DNA-directed RNA polymerase I subunit RPA43 n=1 Tax=Monocercomonoides exilis TaxID=2049356 RepID=UPI00355A9829|nr:putative DNA-directed RNA polymerase I subunit RPA43 [Monocercomonoides exilis]|eukprot:MONOS_3386.1-p1 / transcript=MONOS_3386.1 / gene=MONOS_3386 / organism=Monocercomonoides_exilis_PA203 / gene_product=unspecified product / transcript_product=unspecified product / location=Mono_scaffold00079:94180-95271(+) / protein_length=295 / sequence_SO=supercontig / SO=protein_coding / is_pseudo=false
MIRSPFKTSKVNLDVWLPPSSTEDLDRYIAEYCDVMLLKYTSKLHGVVVSYSDVKVNHSLAVIPDDLALIGLSATAMLSVFSPTSGSLLAGTVQKITSTQVSLLVYGLFNASVRLVDAPSYQFSGGRLVKQRQTKAKNGFSFPSVINESHRVLFAVRGFSADEGVPVLIGSFNEDDVTDTEPLLSDKPAKEKKSKGKDSKGKDIVKEESNDDTKKEVKEEIAIKEEGTIVKHKKSKRKKEDIEKDEEEKEEKEKTEKKKSKKESSKSKHTHEKSDEIDEEKRKEKSKSKKIKLEN